MDLITVDGRFTHDSVFSVGHGVVTGGYRWYRSVISAMRD